MFVSIDRPFLVSLVKSARDIHVHGKGGVFCIVGCSPVSSMTCACGIFGLGYSIPLRGVLSFLKGLFCFFPFLSNACFGGLGTSSMYGLCACEDGYLIT